MSSETWQAMCHKACKGKCMCDTWPCKENACVTHGKPCVHMHVNGEVYKRGGKSVRRGREQQKGTEGKKRRKKREREERERERGAKGNRRSDGRNLSDHEVKSVYSTWATLQQVGILPTLVYFPP